VDQAGNASACVPAGALQPAAEGALAWAPQEALADETVDMAFDGAGRLWVLSSAYVPFPDTRLMLRRRDPGGAWEHVRTFVEAGPAYYPKLAVSSAGDVLAAWWGSDGTRLARLEAATGAWTDTVLEPYDDYITDQVSLAFGPGGDFWACWTVPQVKGATRCAHAAPGEALVTDEVAPFRIYQLYLLPGAGGRARIAWLQQPIAAAHFEVHVRSYVPGAGWSTPSVAATASTHYANNSTAANFDAEVAPDGTAWLATGERSAEGNALLLWRSAPDATDFTLSTRLTGSADALEPRLDAGEGGEAVVLWSPSGRSLRLAHYVPAEGWSAPTPIADDGPGQVWSAGVVCAGPGQAWVYGREHVYEYAAPVSITNALPIVARPFVRGAGLGRPQLVLDDTLRTHQYRTPTFFVADAEGRIAAAQQFSVTRLRPDGGTQSFELDALRVLE
jgi:hypothetical protein